MRRHLAWLMVLAGAAQAHPGLTSVFGPGEQTDYEVSYLGITAGRARLTVGWQMEQFGRAVWPLVCDGESTLGAIYPVKDRFISYWDPSARRTLGADFFIDENKQRRRDRYVYDFDAMEALVTRQRPGEATGEKRVAIEQGTVDLAAAGFGLRNTPLVAGQVHELPVFTGNRLYKMKASVMGREQLTTRLGPLEVFRVTVNGEFNGALKTRGLMTLFYTADEKQLPVRAEAEFLLGRVRLEAVRYLPGRTYKENE